MKKNTIKRVLFSAEFVLCSYIMYIIVFKQQSLMKHKKSEMRDLQEKIKYEENLADELNKEKEEINTDEYIEKIAREKLGMVKKDEKIFYDINAAK